MKTKILKAVHLFAAGFRDAQRNKYNKTAGHTRAKTIWSGGTRWGKFAAIIALLALAALPVKADNTTPDLNPGNLISNASATVTVLRLANSVIPEIDVTLTNTFQPNEFELLAGSAWKSVTASGSTPYLDIGIQKYFARWQGADLGVWADTISLGNGAGSSSIDSVSILGVARKSVGNFAGFAVAGVGRDFGLNKYRAEFGGGFELRYMSGLGLNVATRFVYGGDADAEKGFLTTICGTYHF